MDHGKSYAAMVGERIRFFRKKARMSQVSLGEAVGYTSSGSISLVERGKIMMEPEKINKAAEILNVDPIILTTREDLTNEQLVILSNLFKIFRVKGKTPHYDSIKSLIELDVMNI